MNFTVPSIVIHNSLFRLSGCVCINKVINGKRNPVPTEEPFESVKSDPGKNMKACEDFLSIVLSSHIVVAAQTILKSTPGDLTIHELSNAVVEKIVNFLSKHNHGIDETEDSVAAVSNDDLVHVYACEIVSLGLLWHSYHDAVKEGDGERMLMIWKYLLVIFNSSRQKNYTKEAIILLLQHQYLFSVWDRFVNTQGRPGCNVPADLHMEHLNKWFKAVLRNLGANIQPHAIVRLSKAIGVVHSILSTFENELGRKKDSAKHTTPSAVKDIGRVVSVLEKADVFATMKRKHLQVHERNTGFHQPREGYCRNFR